MSLKNNRQPRKLSVQPLEKRELFAGDVQVAFDSADSRDLEITGDDQDNWIVIEQVSDDRVRITGNDGTTINGQSNPLEFTVRDDMRINMHGGDDHVGIDGVSLDGRSHSDLEINTHDGDDRIYFWDSYVRDDATFDTGDGDDLVLARDSHVRDNFTVKGRSGDDSLLLRDVEADDVWVYAGGDKDEVEFRNVNSADELYASMGSGDDVLSVRGSSASRPDFYGGSGSDQLRTRVWEPNDFWAPFASSSFESTSIF